MMIISPLLIGYTSSPFAHTAWYFTAGDRYYYFFEIVIPSAKKLERWNSVVRREK